MRRITKQNKGITLIEVLVYISVISLSIISFTSYFLMMNSISVKNKVISSIEGDSNYIFNLLENKIFNAENLVYPEKGNASSTMIIAMSEGPDLKIFSELGILYLEEITGDIFQISSSDDVLEELRFDVSNSDKTNIKVSFLLKKRNETSKEFTYGKKYYNSFTLR